MPSFFYIFQKATIGSSKKNGCKKFRNKEICRKKQIDRNLFYEINLQVDYLNVVSV